MQNAIDTVIPPLEIAGFRVRQLICKNDNCRKVLGYERLEVGVVILFCQGCKMTSIWKFSYSRMKQNFDTLVDEFVEKPRREGGEK